MLRAKATPAVLTRGAARGDPVAVLPTANSARMDPIERIELRAAVPGDLAAILRISTGPVAGKHAFVADSFARREVVVASAAERVVGYIIWDRAFFGRPFVWLMGVDPQFRRRGIAVRLMHAFETACPAEARFTSTNESNLTMQALLTQLGFVPSGRVENLDPGDPELFYYKAPTH